MSNCVHMKLKWPLLVLTFICAFFSVPAVGQNVEIMRSDFEDGTGKWEARGTGSVSIRSTKDEALSGEKSLRIRGRREFWQGAQLNVTDTLSPGKTYLFTVSVKLAKGEAPDQVKLMMQRGDSKWDGLAGGEAKAEEWLTLSGRFKPDGRDPYLLVYIEAARERTSFYIDDFKIEELAAPKQSGTILKNDFEDATAQNWFVRGENVQMFSAAVDNSRFLKIDGRNEPWHGLVIDVSPLLYKGRTYFISVSVMLAEGEATDKLKLTMMQTAPDGKSSFVDISRPTSVTDADWVRIRGEYTVTTDDNNLVVVVEAEGAKTSYYIDDFEIAVP